MTQPVEIELSPVATGMSADDLADLPDDVVRRELIDGELFVTPAPSIRHQDVVVTLVALLRGEARELGVRVLTAPVDLRVSASTVLQPDVAVIRGGRPQPPAGDHLRTADIAVEVSSPSTRRHDLLRKRVVYERLGVPEFWFVDLEAERIEVHRHDGETYGPPDVIDRDGTVTSTAIPGLTVEVADVLRGWDEA
jgi:Uma2 family endonuclease